MGRKIPGASFFRRITGKKTSPHNAFDDSDSSSSSSSSATPTKPRYSSVSDDSRGETAQTLLIDDENQPLPPPPGRLQPHHRAASYHHQSPQHSSASASSKLVWSRSSGATSLWRSSDKKKLNHEDSIWKKTIILGERCRVPDEDDDTILYDENGNRISMYHPKNVISRQNSAVDQDAIPQN